MLVTGPVFSSPYRGAQSTALLLRGIRQLALLLVWVPHMLTAAALLLPFGRLADIIGRRKVFLTGLGFFTLVSFLCSLATSTEMLVALRLLQGVAAAMIFSTSTAILTSVYPPARMGKALGMTVASTYTGLSLGPVLGGWMNHNYGWRSIFYFIVIISLVVTISTAVWLKGEWRGAEGERYDLAGVVLYVVGLAAFLYGVSSLSSSTGLDQPGWACAGFFHLFELGRSIPDPDETVREIFLCVLQLAAMINYSATFGWIPAVHLSAGDNGLQLSTAGMIFSPSL